MTGLITPSMPLMVVENRAFGNRAYATLNEGLGKVLRFGANDASVLQRPGLVAAGRCPMLHAALQRSGGLDLRVLMAQALLMGMTCISECGGDLIIDTPADAASRPRYGKVEPLGKSRIISPGTISYF
jgi:hypothetical protein